MIWTTFAEFPGTILACVLIDWIGRKKTLTIQSIIFAISTLGVMECSISKNFLIVLLFCSRGAATGLLQSVYVYTPEAYPTNLRAVALGKIRLDLVRACPDRLKGDPDRLKGDLGKPASNPIVY